MRIFITGIDGFIGKQLAAVALQRKYEVFGLSRKYSGKRNGVSYLRGDLTQARLVSQAVAKAKPQQVFHLAAQSHIPTSFSHPADTMQANVLGSIHVFEAVRRFAPQARLLSVGSSAEYGKSAKQKKVKEAFPLQPTSPYGVSKVSQGLLAQVYAQAHHLKIVHIRPFAIVGPGKRGDALSDFCQGIVRVERGQAKQVKVGDLSAVRDFVDVRDFIQALFLVTKKGQPGQVYNICNGRGHTLEEMMSILLKAARQPIQITTSAAKRRPADDSKLVGDASSLKAMGYAPRYTFSQTILDTLDYWRAETA